MFRGATPELALMSCHAAVLSPGHSPHPPHAHGDEELLMVLDGEADLLVADRPEYEGACAVRVKAGDFAYYPPLQHLTIRNASDAPVHYLMFRWRGHAAATGANILGPSIFQAPPEAAAGTGLADLAHEGVNLLTPYAGRGVVNAGAVVFVGVVEDYLWRGAASVGDPRADDWRSAAAAAYRRLDAPWWLRRVSAQDETPRRRVGPVRRSSERRSVELRPLPGGAAWSVGPVGVVVVSGLPQLEDHRMVVAALRAHLG